MLLQGLLQVCRPTMLARIGSNKGSRLLWPPLFISMVKSDLFTYVWAIENASAFYRGKVKSPSFNVPSVEGKWRIELCLQNKENPDMMIFKVLRKVDNEFVEVTDTDYGMSIIAADGVRWYKQTFMSLLLDNKQPPFLVFRDDVFEERKSTFLPNNTITLQCRIGVPTDGYCFARSRLGIERMSLFFNKEEFLVFDVDLNLTAVWMKQDFKLRSFHRIRRERGNDAKYAENDDGTQEAFNLSTCKIFFSDGLGNEECVLEETPCDFTEEGHTYLPLVKESTLENDAQFANFLFTFYSGVSTEEIELKEYGKSYRREYSSFLFGGEE